MKVPAAWVGMVHAIQDLGRPGIASMAVSAVNAALWDLKARLLDFSNYLNNVLEIDCDNQRAKVQPGTILDEFRSAAEQRHLTLGPDSATHTHCTLGGMIGNNSCGIHSVMAGRTADIVDELDIVTYSGLHTD